MINARSLNCWLYGWKDIATYIGCSVKAARGYAQDYGLPIARLPGKERMKIVAHPGEIDNWIKRIKK